MKLLCCILTVGLLAPSVVAYSQEPRDNNGRPCYDVNIQINRNNRANVRQNCAYNDSRTMQAGQDNDASTAQKGDVNNNEVHQYEYNGAGRRR